MQIRTTWPRSRRTIWPAFQPLMLVLMIVAALPFAPAAVVQGQHATPSLSCEPLAHSTEMPAPATPDAGTESVPSPAITGDPLAITIGYVPISIYAPIFVAQEKGYYAQQGLDVTLEAFAGGTDPIALTGSGELEFASVGAAPAFWNGVALGLPIDIVAPGHAEGSPVATPLMISKEDCLSGEITSVEDLRGKPVAINARGATEYWLAQALAVGGLTLDDIDLQTIPFPDAIAALEGGAIEASMMGEPLATLAEQQGAAVRLLADFPVQDIQPTAIIGNTDFLEEHPEAGVAFVTAYLQAVRDLSGSGFRDPENLAIIEEYTSVPADLLATSVAPVYFPNGEISEESLSRLQSFFRERDQLEYDENVDPSTVIAPQYVEEAVTVLGRYPS